MTDEGEPQKDDDVSEGSLVRPPEVEPSVTEIPAAELPEGFGSTEAPSEAPAPKTGRSARIPRWVLVSLAVVIIAAVGVFVVRRSSDVRTPSASASKTNQAILADYADGKGGKTIRTESFRATFPTAPRDYAQTFAAGNTRVPIIFTTSFIAPDVFSISVADYRGQKVKPRSVLDEWLRGSFSRKGSKLLRSRFTSVGRNPAVDYEVRSSRGYFDARLLFARGRLYNILVSSKDKGALGFERFRDSFHVVTP
jgi:hypothetical protein